MSSKSLPDRTSYKYWSLALSGSAWSSPLSVGSTSQDYGPVPASVASLGASATIGFIDGQSPNLNWVAEADLVSGSWGSTTDVAGPESFTVSPSLVPLTSGPELMMVFVASSGSQIQYVTRTSGSWSPAASIANASTGNAVALAPLPSGGAVLAFRGTDGNLYWSQYAGSAWSNVAAFSSPNVAISGSPAVAHGVNGDTAEISYVGTDGTAYAAHLASGTWSSPTQVGGSSLPERHLHRRLRGLTLEASRKIERLPNCP